MSEIKEIKPEVNQEVVNLLETSLKLAKEGLIHSVAIATTNSNATSCNAFYCAYNEVQLLGELTVLQREIIDHYVPLRREPLYEL